MITEIIKNKKFMISFNFFFKNKRKHIKINDEYDISTTQDKKKHKKNISIIFYHYLLYLILYFIIY